MKDMTKTEKLVTVKSVSRRVPALVINGKYAVYTRHGQEYILDWHGGYVRIKEAGKAGIILEECK